MPFLIDASDAPGKAELRQQVRPEHLEYLTRNVGLLLAAGAKLSDDGAKPLGSFYLVNLEERPAAQAFIDGDPYVRNGVFGPIVLTRVRKGFFDYAPRFSIVLTSRTATGRMKPLTRPLSPKDLVTVIEGRVLSFPLSDFRFGRAL